MAPGDTDQLGTTKSSKPEVGQIVRLDSCKFVHYIKSSGAVEDWDTDTSSLPVVPVLHHGAVTNGMKKSRFCFNSVKESYRCRKDSKDCSFAHSWDERLEYICPVCTDDECLKKRQHMSKYKLWGVYVVEDGRSVSDYLNSLNK